MLEWWVPSHDRSDSARAGLAIFSVRSLPLCGVDIILGLDFLYSNLHAFFAEADILLLHLLRRFIRDISRNRVCGIANESGNGQHYEKDDKRYRFG